MNCIRRRVSILTFKGSLILKNMKYFFYGFLLINLFVKPSPAQQIDKKVFTKLADKNRETPIYSKHWLDKLPSLKKHNPLLIHDLFLISFDLDKKFPSWIAYQLSPGLVWGELKAKRKYVLDPLLSPQQSIHFKHYKGASNCDKKGSGYDKGHLAPLGSFKGSPYIYQAQYLSNIVPQKRNLNQGPWRALEESVRAFVKKGNVVKILTGPLFGKEGENKTAPCWKAGQGVIQEIPVSYWKIIAFRQKGKIKVCSVLMPQNISHRKAHPKKYQVKFEEIEKQTGLLFFSTTKQQALLPACKFLF